MKKEINTDLIAYFEQYYERRVMPLDLYYTDTTELREVGASGTQSPYENIKNLKIINKEYNYQSFRLNVPFSPISKIILPDMILNKRV